MENSSSERSRFLEAGHPVSSITEAEIAARVAVISAQARQVWLGTRADI